MLKITKSTMHGNTKIKLDGNLRKENLNELISILAKIDNDKKCKLILDMSGVSFIDYEALKQVIRFKKAGGTIINCSLYLNAVLKTYGISFEENYDA